MRKIFIFILFVMNLVYFNHAMASSNIDQSIIFNGETNPGDDKGKEKNPEDDCD